MPLDRERAEGVHGAARQEGEGLLQLISCPSVLGTWRNVLISCSLYTLLSSVLIHGNTVPCCPMHSLPDMLKSRRLCMMMQ